MKAKIALVAALLATACHKPATSIDNGSAAVPATASQTQSPAATPTAGEVPSANDAVNAVIAAQPYVGNFKSIRYLVGMPNECTAGVMNGSNVQVCRVCANLVQIPQTYMYTGDIKAYRYDFIIPFKKAISVNTPDIAPVPGAAGVWVAYLPVGPNGSPTVNYQVMSTAELRPEDARRMGYSTRVSPSGVEMQSGPMRGFSIQEDSLPLMNKLMGENLPQLFPTLGACEHLNHS